MSRRPAVVGGLVAVALAGLLAVTLSRGSRNSDNVSAGRSRSSSTTTTQGASPGAAGGPLSASSSASRQSPAVSGLDEASRSGKAVASGGATSVPLDVSVSNTSGLNDGDPVTVRVTPKSGAVVYGFEAFLCKGDQAYLTDFDVRPTRSGKCVTRPLSSGSQDYVEVRAAPPYSVAQTAFRVGTGSDTYQMADGRPTTVTCSKDSPCALVLKMQFPNGYGFQAIQLKFQ